MAYLYKDGQVNTSARDDGTGKPITDVNVGSTAIAVPVDVQFANVQATTQTLTQSIRNTANNWTLTNGDWSHYKNIVFRATNTHNQAITISIQLQDNGVFNNASNSPIQVTIPAGATNMLITPDDLPILKYTIAEQVALCSKATVAPTSGTLTLVIYSVPLGA
jgi:hypothetical protein